MPVLPLLAAALALQGVWAGPGLNDLPLPVSGYQARACVEGRSATLPPELCLRANILSALRRFNGRIRVHLVDIDTPPAAIRRHLLAIQQQTGAAVRVPETRDIKKRGLRTVEDLERLASGEQLRRELRTIRHSIHALQQGLDIAGSFKFKGSPYLEDREEAIWAPSAIAHSRRSLSASSRPACASSP